MKLIRLNLWILNVWELLLTTHKYTSLAFLYLIVAQHIAPNLEPIYIYNIDRLSKSGIVFSWATVGQDENSHVNERDELYITCLMKKFGYFYDSEATTNIRGRVGTVNACCEGLSNSTYVFNRDEGWIGSSVDWKDEEKNTFSQATQTFHRSNFDDDDIKAYSQAYVAYVSSC